MNSGPMYPTRRRISFARWCVLIQLHDYQWPMSSHIHGWPMIWKTLLESSRSCFHRRLWSDLPVMRKLRLTGRELSKKSKRSQAEDQNGLNTENRDELLAWSLSFYRLDIRVLSMADPCHFSFLVSCPLYWLRYIFLSFCIRSAWLCVNISKYMFVHRIFALLQSMSTTWSA